MFGRDFYNETTRRYVAVFGTLFNDISIVRTNNDGSYSQTMKVPVNYAPMQKILARLEQDPNLDAPAMTLPRISFEITGMTYSAERNLPRNNMIRAGAAITNSLQTQYTPAPYDIEFQLNIMTKYNEDGTKILEQILPFFKPDFTVSVKILDELDLYVDIPVVLNSVSTEDVYEGSFEERRALIWTLSFTLKGYYFGPTSNKKVIKFSEAKVTTNDDITYPDIKVNVQPGLTANNEPTTSLDDTVDYADIDINDNWAYIVTVQDIEDIQ